MDMVKVLGNTSQCLRHSLISTKIFVISHMCLDILSCLLSKYWQYFSYAILCIFEIKSLFVILSDFMDFMDMDILRFVAKRSKAHNVSLYQGKLNLIHILFTHFCKVKFDFVFTFYIKLHVLVQYNPSFI